MNRTALFIIAFVALRARAEDAPAPQPKPALSAEEAARLRNELRGVAEALGIPQSAAPPAQSKAEKTVAQVADRALDMVGGMVANVAVSMQKVAPEIWRIMIRQQYAKAVADLGTPIGVLILVLVWHLIARRLWGVAKWKDCDGDASVGFAFTRVLVPCCGALSGAAWFIVAFSNSVKYVINPEFYAVRDLLTLVLNPGRCSSHEHSLLLSLPDSSARGRRLPERTLPRAARRLEAGPCRHPAPHGPAREGVPPSVRRPSPGPACIDGAGGGTRPPDRVVHGTATDALEKETPMNMAAQHV